MGVCMFMLDRHTHYCSGRVQRRLTVVGALNQPFSLPRSHTFPSLISLGFWASEEKKKKGGKKKAHSSLFPFGTQNYLQYAAGVHLRSAGECLDEESGAKKREKKKKEKKQWQVLNRGLYPEKAPNTFKQACCYWQKLAALLRRTISVKCTKSLPSAFIRPFCHLTHNHKNTHIHTHIFQLLVRSPL